jgi:hypothetical protein
MNTVHSAVEHLAPPSGGKNHPAGDSFPEPSSELNEGTSQEETRQDEPATVAAAQAVSSGVFQHRLTEPERKVAGPLIHYGYGTLMGAVYGVLAEAFPRTRTGGGTGYGAALWLLGDELAVPVLGLAPAATQVTASTHATALGAHLVYGLTTEAVRRGINAAWDSGRRQ